MDAADDPFSSITKRCQISSSQEELLRPNLSAGGPEVEEEQTDDMLSEDLEDQLTGIMMVTPPTSPLNNNDENDHNNPKGNEYFQTPLEIASSDGHRRDDRTVFIEEETEGGGTVGDMTVDLEADKKVVFSEVELALRSSDNVNEVIQSQLNRVRAIKRELAAREFVIESLKKKSKISDNHRCSSESPKVCLGEKMKKIMKTMDKLKSSPKDIPYKCGVKSPQSNQNSEGSGESSGKRKLDFSTENLGFESEASDRGLGFNEGLELSMKNIKGGSTSVCNDGTGAGTSNLGQKSIEEDIDKDRHTDPSVCTSSEMGTTTRAKRALPGSICQKGEDKDARNDSRKFSVWDVLRMLAKNCNCDHHHGFEGKSILDVAKSRGMTFP